MKHPEQVKHIITDCFKGNETQEEWTKKYEILKEELDFTAMGEFIDIMIKLNYKLEEINKMIKSFIYDG